MEQRNLILAFALSTVIIIAWIAYQTIFMPPRPVPPPTAQTQTEAPATTGSQAPSTVPAPGTTTGAPAAVAVDRETALTQSPRVAIDSPSIKGSIALKGGRIDDVVLVKYRETIDPNSPNIVLFSPSNAPHAYYAEFGWSAAGSDVKLPDASTVWQADADKLTPEKPLTLTWDNGQGLKFARVFTLDKDYLFTVTQRVENSGASPTLLYPYGRVLRVGKPKTLGFFILHEGFLGVFNGTLAEEKYDTVSGAKDGVLSYDSTGGWLGITDKYWLAAVAPAQSETVKASYQHTLQNGNDVFQSSFIDGAGVSVAPGGKTETTGYVFAGAKQVDLVNRYAQTPGIQRFDLAIDWGWLYFLTKPIFWVLDHIYGIVGNFGISILILTLIVKTLFFPLANKSYRAMNKMKKLAPEMTKLRERFPDDKQRMNAELMALYKREKVNPAAGCLPIVVQIPVFFALYKVLFVTIEMRHAPFFGWIRDLSAPDPTTILNLFGLLPYTVPTLPGPLHIISIGIWPIIMGLTMFLQQKMNPAPPDPVQAKIFMLLPIVFTFMLAPFPAGLVIYWAWNNLLSVAQQWVLKRAEERRAKPA
jgi:YidC/Oxa1 family membrane protein insertase